MKAGNLPKHMTAVTPFLTVTDVDQAVAFYTEAFGFALKFKMPGPGGKTAHAEVTHDTCSIMLGGQGPGCAARLPDPSETPPFGLYIYVEDVDKFLTHASAHGATVKQECLDQFWGDRMCTLMDPFGYSWSFATYVREVSPEEMQQAMATMACQAAGASA